MADCKYCGQAAGFLRSTHKECKVTYTNGRRKIIGLVKGAVHDNSLVDRVRADVADVARKALVPGNELRGITIEGWCSAVENAFEDGVLSMTEQSNLLQIQKNFEFGQDELDGNGSY